MLIDYIVVHSEQVVAGLTNLAILNAVQLAWLKTHYRPNSIVTRARKLRLITAPFIEDAVLDSCIDSYWKETYSVWLAQKSQYQS